jgi:uncharacterized protein YceK
MARSKLLALLVLGTALIGGCASTSSERGRSSGGASSSNTATDNNLNASFHYPNY